MRKLAIAVGIIAFLIALNGIYSFVLAQGILSFLTIVFALLCFLGTVALYRYAKREDSGA